MDVELIVGNNGKLVPMRDRGLEDAIKGTGGTSACVDNIGNLSCQIYKITLTNNASRLRRVAGSI